MVFLTSPGRSILCKGCRCVCVPGCFPLLGGPALSWSALAPRCCFLCVLCRRDPLPFPLDLRLRQCCGPVSFLYFTLLLCHPVSFLLGCSAVPPCLLVGPWVCSLCWLFQLPSHLHCPSIGHAGFFFVSVWSLYLSPWDNIGRPVAPHVIFCCTLCALVFSPTAIMT